MGLDDLKKQEDMKNILGDLTAQETLKIEEKAKELIKIATSDFERFFTEKDFSVKKDERSIKAQYGSLSAELKHDSKLFAYIGSIFVFDLLTALPNKEKYVISLHSGASGAVITFHGSDKEAMLKNEIERTRARLENFEDETWEFRIKRETGFTSTKQLVEAPPVFKSIYALLASIVK